MENLIKLNNFCISELFIYKRALQVFSFVFISLSISSKPIDQITESSALWGSCLVWNFVTLIQ